MFVFFYASSNIKHILAGSYVKNLLAEIYRYPKHNFFKQKGGGNVVSGLYDKT